MTDPAEDKDLLIHKCSDTLCRVRAFLSNYDGREENPDTRIERILDDVEILLRGCSLHQPTLEQLKKWEEQARQYREQARSSVVV